MKRGSLVVVTGASRGIGQAVALSVADAFEEPLLSPPLRLVLIARSAEPLRETARLVEQRFGGGDSVTTSCHEVDLSDLDALPERLQRILEPLSVENQYDSCWLINNAGSLGPLGVASSMSGASSIVELRKAIDLNVTAGIWVSSQFTRTFLATSSSTSSPAVKSPVVRIVNISSLCAIEPFPTMSTYCAGKAGRDMFHAVLAKEHSPSPAKNNAEENNQEDSNEDSNSIPLKQMFKVLNYAPGPCDTKMTEDLAQCSDLDHELHDFFATSKEKNKLVRPQDTANKLVQILLVDEFESGSHIDYYDDSEMALVRKIK